MMEPLLTRIPLLWRRPGLLVDWPHFALLLKGVGDQLHLDCYINNNNNDVLG